MPEGVTVEAFAGAGRLADATVQAPRLPVRAAADARRALRATNGGTDGRQRAHNDAT